MEGPTGEFEKKLGGDRYHIFPLVTWRPPSARKINVTNDVVTRWEEVVAVLLKKIIDLKSFH